MKIRRDSVTLKGFAEYIKAHPTNEYRQGDENMCPVALYFKDAIRLKKGETLVVWADQINIVNKGHTEVIKSFKTTTMFHRFVYWLDSLEDKRDPNQKGIPFTGRELLETMKQGGSSRFIDPKEYSLPKALLKYL